MKRVKLVIHESSINKVIGRELNLLLNDKANLVDAIGEVDKLINNKGGFQVPDYRSLLHMVYNPIENRFYKQVAVTAHKENSQMLNVRGNPKKELPEGMTIIHYSKRRMYRRVGRSYRLRRIFESNLCSKNHNK